MIILVLNCGSSSVKYGLFSFSGSSESEIARGTVEYWGLPDSLLEKDYHGKHAGGLSSRPLKANSTREALSYILDRLLNLDGQEKGIHSPARIDAVGHRVVHGGERFTVPTLIESGVMGALKECSSLAPLHNPSNLEGIEAASALLPGVPQVAVFDTAFHQTLSPRAYLYAIPYEMYRDHGIRRYGFHGTSHSYVATETARLIGRGYQDLRIVTCHLGSGCSVAAVMGGRSVDTSMGFTPMEGLVMSTRCGDIDPAVIFHLLSRGCDPAKLEEMLMGKSGLLGISGCSSDARVLIDMAYLDPASRTPRTDHPRSAMARLALEIFTYRLRKYIGAYAAAMGGLDALTFTGGIGENSSLIREEACRGLEFLGVKLGQPRDLGGGCFDISSRASRIRVLVIPSREELKIARDTYQLLEKS